MTQEIIRDIASDISVISIALLAVIFILMSLSWKGFENKFSSLPHTDKRELLKRGAILIILILIPVATVTVVGINSPSMAQGSAVLVMFGFGAISVLYLLVMGIRRLINLILRRKHRSNSIKLDEPTTLYFISLVFLTISIICSICALLGSISSALEMNISPNQSSDFNQARWLLMDAVLFFISGIFGTGLSYITDRTRIWKTNQNSDLK